MGIDFDTSTEIVSRSPYLKNKSIQISYFDSISSRLTRKETYTFVAAVAVNTIYIGLEGRTDIPFALAEPGESKATSWRATQLVISIFSFRCPKPGRLAILLK